MVLFAIAFIIALLGVGAYDLYNPGAVSITMPGYHFVGVPAWVPVALGAAAPLSLFLLHALWTGLRVWLLKGALRRTRKWADAEYWPPVERRVELRPVQQSIERPVERWPAAERPTRQLRMAPKQIIDDVPLPFRNNRRKRASQAPSQPAGPQPAPKRSWLNRD